MRLYYATLYNIYRERLSKKKREKTLLMRSHSKGVVSSVECDELRLEHNVTVNLEVGSGGLETSEAGCEELMLAYCSKREKIRL